MQDRVRILHLEDNLLDAELIQRALEDQGVMAAWTRVETPEALSQELREHPFDLIISDFTFPTFNGLNALETARRFRPDIPFVFVSGTIGEEKAVEAMRRGATDYVLKDKIFRLGAVVRRALAGTSLRVQRTLAEKELHRVSEQLTRLLIASPAVIYSAASDGSFAVTFISENVFAVLGYQPTSSLKNRASGSIISMKRTGGAFGRNIPGSLTMGTTYSCIDFVITTAPGDGSRTTGKLPVAPLRADRRP